MGEHKTAMVIGATGIIGGNLIRHLDTLNDWDVVGLSRGEPDYPSQMEHISVDLLDLDDCKSKLGHLSHVTHIFFAGYTDRPTWAEQDPPNKALLVNSVRAVAWPRAPSTTVPTSARGPIQRGKPIPRICRQIFT